MATGRYAPTATVLPNRKVLVAGGYNGSTSTTSAQLFDPAANAFSTTGSLRQGRNFATATLLDNGAVLVAGGFHPAYGSLNSAEIYNPQTGAFTAHSAPMNSRRELYTATKLPDGRVLLVGGLVAQGFVPLRSAEIYDPSDPALPPFKPSASALTAAEGRFGHDALLLPYPTDANGSPTKVLIAGGKGISGAGAEVVHRSVEVYDIPTDTFTSVGDMQEGRDRPTLAWNPTLKKVVIAGGQNKTASGSAYGVKQVEYFDPYLYFSETYDPATMTPFSDGPALARERMAHSLTVLLSPDRFMVTGGWSDSLTSTATSKGKTVTTTGNTTSSAEVFSVDPLSLTGAFTAAPAMNYSRHDHGAVLLGDGRVMVLGGTRVENGAESYPPYAEIYTP
jgi:hypothetical protein